MAGHRFNPEKAGKLIDSSRRKVITPEQVISMLQIENRDVIADLGAGNGYFTVPMAMKTEEPILAVDIQPEMLKLLKKHAEEKNVKNIRSIESGLEQIPIEDGVADKILIAFVLHEVPDIDKVMDELKRMKKPEGKILILEWQAVEAEMGPPLHERIPLEDLKQQVEKNGFVSEGHNLNEQIYGLLLK
ncbi:class I SAM-dependent methyltransferase [Mesobacillus harenae]|uniref:class I SAM-dependent methyltransferase n=1 Tax=Mesobacillus harenae TaxID=2213203 RepID=UPI001580A711|nr:methyltransferase domain-containing protein [Mesobacillus harenae]